MEILLSAISHLKELHFADKANWTIICDLLLKIENFFQEAKLYLRN